MRLKKKAREVSIAFLCGSESAMSMLESITCLMTVKWEEHKGNQ
jgi:hypothetical protein